MLFRSITPTWAKPLAAPPPKASASFGLTSGLDGCLGGSTLTGGVAVHAARTTTDDSQNNDFRNSMIHKMTNENGRQFTVLCRNRTFNPGKLVKLIAIGYRQS